jgi:hypothetical protein
MLALVLSLFAGFPLTGSAQDPDGDGVPDSTDNCPGFDFWNPSQGNLDGDSQGDACDSDPDGDGVLSDDDIANLDNCPWTANANQALGTASGIGAACPPASLPLTLTGVSASSPVVISLDLDVLPPRPEVVVDIEPASAELNSELKVICRGASEASLRDPSTGFLGDYTLKIDANRKGVTDGGFTCGGRTQRDGTWVLPAFLLYTEAAFNQPSNAHDLACFLILRSYGTPPPGGTIDVHVFARTIPPTSGSQSHCQTGCDTDLGFMVTEGKEYTCFSMGGTNYRFLDRGNPVIGQCSYADANPVGPFPEIRYTISSPNQWDCCIWQYDMDGLSSEKGFSNFWTGSGAPGPRPDGDLDGILQRCDNCSAISNANQRDSDSDSSGDFCDACPFNANNANGDVIPAGNACQCSDVDAVGGTNLADVVRIARFLADAPLSPIFNLARCRISSGLDPIFNDQCGASGLSGLRALLARGDAPIESCG